VRACIGYYLERALAAGGSADEAREAIGVAIMIGRGPAAVDAARAGEILDERLTLLSV
jgi:alkylhydroperoxidase/carboxymuconolactone decarboxylase family protein YurZ